MEKKEKGLIEEIKPYLGIISSVFLAELIISAIALDLSMRSNFEKADIGAGGLLIVITLSVSMYYLGKHLRERYNLTAGIIVPIVVALLVLGIIAFLQFGLEINVAFWIGVFHFFLICITIFSVIAYVIYDAMTH